MTLNAYPFENANTTEEQYTLLFRNFADSGIVGDYGDAQFAVTSDGSGLDVQVAAGYAILRGHAVNNDGPVTAPVDAADAALPRLDRLVLRLNPATDGITLVVLKGTPATEPVAPSLTRTDTGIWDLPLATIRVEANALSITQGNITSQRSWGSHRFGVWTTAERPVAPYIGKPGYNITTNGAEVWNGTVWEAVVTKRKLQIPHTFTLAGPVVLPAGDDYYVPPFMVPSPAGQTVKIKGFRHILRTGGTVLFTIAVNGTTVSTGTSTTTAQSSSALDYTVPDNGVVSLTVTGITGSPKNMTCALFLEYEA